MAKATLTLNVHVAWWVSPYIKTCALFAMLFGMEPDADKIARTAMRGFRLKKTR